MTRWKSFRCFQLAADQNYASAQLILGLCYVRGIGVAENKDIAVRWFRKAARKGSLGACFERGNGVAIFVDGNDWLLLKDCRAPNTLPAPVICTGNGVAMNKKEGA